jgi:hypothetical protein
MMSVVFRQAARSTFSCRGNSDDDDRRQGIRLVGEYDWRTPTFSKVFMPYLLQRIEVPGRKHAFLPPNRGYVPLGMPHSAGHVKYSDADIIATHAVYFSRDTTRSKACGGALTGTDGGTGLTTTVSLAASTIFAALSG